MVTHDIVSALEIADTLLLLGRDCDEKGKLLPGARIQAQYNLIDRGLTWRPDITSLPAFTETLKEVRDRFPLL